jgi:MYXO-CTERM domain-containing protein
MDFASSRAARWRYLPLILGAVIVAVVVGLPQRASACLAFNAPCSTDDECATGLCWLAHPGGAVCFQCTAAADCAEGSAGTTVTCATGGVCQRSHCAITDSGTDTGAVADTATAVDTGTVVDSGSAADTATAADTGVKTDTGSAADTGAAQDTGTTSDATGDTMPVDNPCASLAFGAACGDGMACTDDGRCVLGAPKLDGCGCSAPGTTSDGAGAAFAAGALALAVVVARRRRQRGATSALIGLRGSDNM